MCNCVCLRSECIVFVVNRLHTYAGLVCEMLKLRLITTCDIELSVVAENRAADTTDNTQLRSTHCTLWY